MPPPSLTSTANGPITTRAADVTIAKDGKITVASDEAIASTVAACYWYSMITSLDHLHCLSCSAHWCFDSLAAFDWRLATAIGLSVELMWRVRWPSHSTVSKSRHPRCLHLKWQLHANHGESSFTHCLNCLDPQNYCCFALHESRSAIKEDWPPCCSETARMMALIVNLAGCCRSYSSFSFDGDK